MSQLENFISQFQDKTISVSVYDLETNQEINIHADELMHPASTMKVPVMIEVFHQASAGIISLDEEIEIYNLIECLWFIQIIVQTYRLCIHRLGRVYLPHLGE